MTYNHDIKEVAPLPTGALPTDDEIMALIRRAQQKRSEAFVKLARKVFKRCGMVASRCALRVASVPSSSAR